MGISKKAHERGVNFRAGNLVRFFRESGLFELKFRTLKQGLLNGNSIEH